MTAFYSICSFIAERYRNFSLPKSVQPSGGLRFWKAQMRIKFKGLKMEKHARKLKKGSKVDD